MAKLFIDFTNEKLQSQYDRLSYKLLHNDDMRLFIEACFPPEDMVFNLSYPAFEKAGFIEKGRRRVMENIFLCPNKTIESTYYIPDNLSLIVRGEIENFREWFKFNVDYIAVIDNSCIPNGNQIVQLEGEPKLAFQNGIFGAGSEFNDPHTKFTDYSDSCLNLEKCKSLALTKAIQNEYKALAKIKQWEEYIEFRNYWLKIRSNSDSSFKINSVEVLEAFSISKSDYRERDHSDSLIDKEFANTKGRDSIIYLKKDISGSSKDPLIKITIIRNKTEVTKDWQRKLNNLLRNPLVLKPSAESFEPYSLGDGKENRVKTIYTNIEPDYTEIENRFKEEMRQKKEDIEKTHNNELKNILSDFKEEKNTQLQEDLNKKISILSQKLESTLENDIIDRKDENINKQAKEKATEISKKQGISYDEAIALVDFRKLYSERNQKRLEDETYEGIGFLQKELKKAIDEKERNEKERLKEIEKTELDKINSDIEQRKMSEKQSYASANTTQRIDIYFKSENEINDINKQNEYLKSFQNSELSYDSYLEKTKLDRQIKALDSLKKGKGVKNPTLGNFLFAPEYLPSVQNREETIEWENPRLNDSQKEAVIKALNASGLFLIQGPPGTGKTTVIAEITVQFVKRNKRVLIASETHKAIDNAFDEIDKLKVPQARLLRLTSKSKNEKTRDNLWDMESQTSNLYNSIAENLKKRTKDYQNFEALRESFDERMSLLKGMGESITSLKTETETIKKNRDKLYEEVNDIDQELGSLIEKYNNNLEQLEDWKESKKQIFDINANNSEKDIDLSSESERYRNTTRSKLLSIFAEESNSCFKSNDIELLLSTNSQQIGDEIEIISAPDEFTQIEMEISSVRAQMNDCHDNLDDILPEKSDDYKKLQGRMRELLNHKSKINDNGSQKKSLSIYSIFKTQAIDEEKIRKTLKQRLEEIRRQLFSVIDDAIREASAKINMFESNISKIESRRKELTESKKVKDAQIVSLSKDKRISDLNEKEKEMKNSIVKFFNDFNVNREYRNYIEALSIMEEEWQRKCSEFEENRGIFEKNMSFMKDISHYIDGGAIERDKESMNKKLVDMANVFGVTSTANSRFKGGKDIEAEVDIAQKDIDVVIIDEVSKSSFLDLLRPILYGKTVILVGDHMQLPPMYDLKHLREEDFEDLDVNRINKGKNKEYLKLVETCFFKELFEKVPDSYKIMLNRQYRFHSQIMDINPFYGGQLQIGSSNLDDTKEHNLNIRIGGKSIITPEQHVCFIDCGESFESGIYDDSRVIINEGEADVVIELLNQICLQTGINNKLSVGVICTYGKQASIIKQRLKRDKRRFSQILTGERQDEKFIVSTVDDFQGDERDIIILCMVRNPRKGKRYNLDFIEQFQRINVAITRPRRLLIIVGAKSFLSEKACVKIPVARGNAQEEIYVFKEIVKKVNKYRGVKFMSDVVLKNKN